MKTKYLISFIIIGFLLIGSAILITKAIAQETNQTAADIQYPVKELGNCENQTACKAYCDKPENTSVCVGFAEKNNLMSKEEIDTAKKFIAAGEVGPGGCTNKDSCETYCNDMSHIDACISFAEKNGLMSAQDLAEAKQIQAAIAKGVKPPPCGNKKACDTYCDDPNHMEECVTFGIAAGFIQGKELEDVQKMLVAIKKGVKPPPCRGKDACDQYCSDPNNMEVCINFAMEAGFMSDQEKADTQKMLEALKKGIKPPPCKGKEDCDTYCQQDAHFQECTDFAVAAGFMSEKDAEMARKTGGKGPGGCKGKDECEAFCNNPDNQQTCFNFAKDNGMIPEADLKQMEEGKQKFKEALDQAPQAVLNCLNSQIGTDLMEKIKSGAVMPPKDIGDKMRTCFESNMGPSGPGGQGGPGAGGMTPPAGQAGPGGCKTEEECKTYCENNPEACKNFGPQGPQDGSGNFQPGPGQINPGGQIMPPQAGPGGCKSPEECQAYCTDQTHQEECSRYGSNNQNPGNQQQPMPPQNQTGPYSPQGGQPGENNPQSLNGTMPIQGDPNSPPPPGAMPPTDQNIQNPQTTPPPPEQTPSNILDLFSTYLKLLRDKN